MKVIYGINQIKKFKNPVVAMGVFDGVHRGHVHILKETVKKAKAIKGRSIALTFWPHPQKEDGIYCMPHRLRLIAKTGIDVTVVINFNKSFAKIKAQDFIEDILIKKINAKYIYVGENFRFGQGAKGDIRLLNKLSRVYGFILKTFGVIKVNHQPISSTYIRNLISKGNLKSAQHLLSRRVSILGTVIKGDSLATRLGYPTANINPHHEISPPSGIYAVKVIFNQRLFNGICYIGTRPTIKSQIANSKWQIAKRIEVHIFNFKKNIYGKYLEIQFIKKIREDRKFASCQALTQQIKKDMFLVKSLFSRHQH